MRKKARATCLPWRVRIGRGAERCCRRSRRPTVSRSDTEHCDAFRSLWSVGSSARSYPARVQATGRCPRKRELDSPSVRAGRRLVHSFAARTDRCTAAQGPSNARRETALNLRHSPLAASVAGIFVIFAHGPHVLSANARCSPGHWLCKSMIRATRRAAQRVR